MRLARDTLRASLVAAAVLPWAPPALAHPHILIDAEVVIVFDDRGRIVAIRDIWHFDEDYSAYAVLGLDEDGDGALSAAELAPLAALNIQSLADYGYFTRAWVPDRVLALGAPFDIGLTYEGNRLTLAFSLPVSELVKPSPTATVSVFDPEYYVAYFLQPSSVSMVGAPAGCAALYIPPEEPDVEVSRLLSAIPADQRDLPLDLKDVAAELANMIVVSCPP